MRFGKDISWTRYEKDLIKLIEKHTTAAFRELCVARANARAIPLTSTTWLEFVCDSAFGLVNGDTRREKRDRWQRFAERLFPAGSGRRAS